MFFQFEPDNDFVVRCMQLTAYLRAEVFFLLLLRVEWQVGRRKNNSIFLPRLF
jgi:hypothetical protein